MTDKNRINLRILAIASNMDIKSVFCARKNFQVIFSVPLISGGL